MIYDKVRTFFGRLGWPTWAEINLALKTYDLKTRSLIALVGIIFLVGVFGLIFSINNYFLVSVAAPGGSLTEGIIGSPRFINPLLETSDSDRDLTSLVYAGLLKPDNNGGFLPDIAKNYEVSDDGLTYTVNLKSNLRWPDGEKLTAEDVVFTVERAKDARVKSVKRANWEGVEAAALSPLVVEFRLAKPYASFLNNLTMGIIPKHFWEKVRTEDFALTDKNINPLGNGPYQITSVEKDSAGIPRTYHLKPFAGTSSGGPRIEKLTIIAYDSEEELLAALSRGQIESAIAISPAAAKKLAADKVRIISASSPRVFSVFFNQSGSGVLANKEVRQALNLATDKESLISKSLFGFGTAIDHPIPPGSAGYLKREKSGANIEGAKEILNKAGWKTDKDGRLTKTVKNGKKTTKQTLAFTLATADNPELKQIAETLARDWQKIGAVVTIEIYESGDLAQNIIQARKYESLLFGEVLATEPDLFPYWHSSQRNYPGLNISMYTNSKVDKLIDEARAATNASLRLEKYGQIQKEIAADLPAIFLFSPNFTYVLPEKVDGVKVSSLVSPADRFALINNWHIESDRVWGIFASQRDILEKIKN